MGKIFASHWSDYELIDAGGGFKLERWGDILTIRPDVNAYFKSANTIQDWRKIAHAEFKETSHTKGDWKFLKEIPKDWAISYQKSTFILRFTPFKHVGLFPEQEFNWSWINEHIHKNNKVLNLFAYTGASSIIARKKGAEVYHVDSIKTVNNWAKTNMESSGLDDIRWVTEDALKFATREAKRGNKYDLVLMDPPAFGFGANNEKWKLDRDLKELLQDVIQLLCKEQHFFVLNTYSPQLAMPELRSMLNQISLFPAQYEAAQLGLKSLHGQFLPLGNLIRFSK